MALNYNRIKPADASRLNIWLHHKTGKRNWEKLRALSLATVQHTHNTWGNAEEQPNSFKSFLNVNKKQQRREWTRLSKPHALRRRDQTPALVWVLLLVLLYRESHSLLHKATSQCIRDKIQKWRCKLGLLALKQHREYALKPSPKPSKTSLNKAHGPNAFHLAEWKINAKKKHWNNYYFIYDFVEVSSAHQGCISWSKIQ